MNCEALNYDMKQFHKSNAYWNNVYRNVFRMQLWKSVKELQFLCRRLDIYHIYS